MVRAQMHKHPLATSEPASHLQGQLLKRQVLQDQRNLRSRLRKFSVLSKLTHQTLPSAGSETWSFQVQVKSYGGRILRWHKKKAK